MNPAPIFLVGTTRSGTTLLTLMLSHHPEISWPGEFDLAVDFMPSSTEYPPLAAYHAWLEMDRHFRGHALRIDPGLDYPALVRSFLAQMKAHAGDDHKRLLGVAVHRGFARLHVLFPEARYLHLVRDPRDVARSWIEHGWAGNVYTAACSWQAIEQEWQELAPRLAPENVLELRFEELIRDATGTLKRICEFIGVAYSEKMLEYPSDTSYGPVDASQGSKWRTKLSPLEQRLVDAAVGPLLEQRGYARSGLAPLRVGPWAAWLLRAQDRAHRLRTRLRLFGIGIWLGSKLTRALGLEAWNRRIELHRQDLVNRQLK